MKVYIASTRYTKSKWGSVANNENWFTEHGVDGRLISYFYISFNPLYKEIFDHHTKEK